MTRTRTALALGILALVLAVGVTAAAPPPVRVLSHGSRTSGEVALTFDDGVSPDNCRRILSTLVARGVPATFFPIAAAMRADPAFWKMVVAVGDPIGDHSLTHPQMPSLTKAQQLHQLTASRKLAESISGAPLMPVFRPPYGAYDSDTLKAASAAGFPTVLLWDTSDRDTSPHGTVAEMLAAAEHATDGSVILMHCGPDATPYLLSALLDHLKAVGLRPVTVPQLLGLAWTATPAASPPTPAQILDGLPPLPPAPHGGVVVGPSGVGSMTFPPAPPPAPASAGPSASGAPSASPAPSASGSGATPTAPVAPSGSGAPSGSPAASGTPVSAASLVAILVPPAAVSPAPPSSGLLGDVAILGLVACLLAAAIIAAGLLRARHR